MAKSRDVTTGPTTDPTKPSDAAAATAQDLSVAPRQITAAATAEDETDAAATGVAVDAAALAVEKTAAEWAYERLVLYIRHFESELDQSQEIAMGFVGGAAGVLSIEGLGYSAPDLVTFYGRDEAGMKTQLVQHVSQLSVILRAVPKLKPQDPPLRIGFRLQSGWAGGEAGDGSAWREQETYP